MLPVILRKKSSGPQGPHTPWHLTPATLASLLLHLQVFACAVSSARTALPPDPFMAGTFSSFRPLLWQTHPEGAI